MHEHQNGYDDIADIHRKMEEEEEQKQTDTHLGNSGLGGLTLSNADDPSEQEADSIATKVGTGASVSMGSLTGTSSSVQTKSEGGEIEDVDSLSGMLSSTKGMGNPMDDDTRGTLESQMNTDFSDVKIHTGTTANKMNEDINAKAFAHGKDLYFRDGYFNPGSKEGKELLAHELVHTKQTNGSEISTKLYRTDFDKKALGEDAYLAYIQNSGTPIGQLGREYYILCEEIIQNHIDTLDKFYKYMTGPNSEDNKVDVEELIISILLAFLKPLGGAVAQFLFNIVTNVQFPIPLPTENEIEWADIGLEGLKESANELKGAYDKKMSQFVGPSLPQAYDQLSNPLMKLKTDFHKKEGVFSTACDMWYGLLDSNDQKLFRGALVSEIVKLNAQLQDEYSVERMLRAMAMAWIADNRKVTKKGRPKASGAHIEYVLVIPNGKSEPELEEVSVHGPKATNIEDLLNANLPEEVVGAQKQTGWHLSEIGVPVHVVLYKEHGEGAESEWEYADRWMITGKTLDKSAQDRRRERSTDETQVLLNGYLKKMDDLPMVTHFGEYDVEADERHKKKEKKRKDKLQSGADNGGYKVEDIYKSK